MKLAVTSFMLIMALSICNAQTETRMLSDFTSISAAEGVQVELVKGDKVMAKVKVENCELSDVITEVNGRELEIKFKKDFWKWRSNKKAWVTVTYTQLEEIEVSSGANIESEQAIEADELELEASSGGRMYLSVASTALYVEVSSGGLTEVTGSTESQDVEASSGGVYEAYNLDSKEARVEASSGGNCRIFVTQKLDAEASSGGSIRYKGDPQSTSIDSNFSGSVRSS